MCVATPGKIIEINGDIAKADVLGNTCNIDIRLVSVEIGDYVLIHAGCALQVLDKQEAEELASLFKEIEDTANENA